MAFAEANRVDGADPRRIGEAEVHFEHPDLPGQHLAVTMEIDIDEDLLRWLCTALLKVTGGAPVHLSTEDMSQPFDLTLTVDNTAGEETSNTGTEPTPKPAHGGGDAISGTGITVTVLPGTGDEREPDLIDDLVDLDTAGGAAPAAGAS